MPWLCQAEANFDIPYKDCGNARSWMEKDPMALPAFRAYQHRL